MKVVIGMLLAACLMMACRPNERTTTPPGMITIDSANKMIVSYLNSINAATNDSDVRSMILDADAFRAYLNDPTIGSQVTHFKVSIAHTLSYINSGHDGQYAGYQSGALSLVVSGLDVNGNYVHYPGGLTINNASHCPPSCPLGTGGNNLLMFSHP